MCRDTLNAERGHTELFEDLIRQINGGNEIRPAANSVAKRTFHDCSLAYAWARLTALRFSRARPYRAWLRDATRRAKQAAEAAGQTNGRASTATASWPARSRTLVQICMNSRSFSDACWFGLVEVTERS